MRFNIDIDDDLLAQAMQAMQAFGAKTKRETVEIALRDAIQIRRQEAIL
ncbi:type II toxin-antitoxin system VapB family antitoxin [Salmonella enterica]|nr:type II toxin-antitoxin system VapB family antitoxin [Salmonella enterica]